MILAIDTATDLLGIGLMDSDAVVSERVWHSRRHHTLDLAPAVALMLREASVKLGDLVAVAVARGPGSYTGLRIGMGFAKGISLAQGIPVIGVPTLDVLAEGQKASDKPLLAVLKAGRGRIAAVWYKWRDSGWVPETEATVLTWEEALASLREPTVVCGEIGDVRDQLARQRLVTAATPALCLRRPALLGALASQRMDEPGPTSAELAPIYLGDVEAKRD